MRNIQRPKLYTWRIGMSNPLTSRRKAITLLRPFIAAWMKRVTNYKLTSPAPSNAGKPYLIISNHVSIYDLAYVLLQLKEMPVIVIYEIFLRNPVVARLLRHLGLIWKQADLHEAKSIRQIKRAAQYSFTLREIFPGTAIRQSCHRR